MSTITASSVTVLPSAARPREATQVRLTARGRAVVFLGALALVMGAAFWLFVTPTVATRDAQATETVLVAPGDTLWGIADEAAGSGSTAEMVYEIKDLNHLDSAMLVAGQQILVPTS